jgi:hypothetical protein
MSLPGFGARRGEGGEKAFGYGRLPWCRWREYDSSRNDHCRPPTPGRRLPNPTPVLARTTMTSKNTICLWCDDAALEAAEFFA